MLLSRFPEEILDLRFGDDIEARKDFGRYLAEMELQYYDDLDTELLSTDNVYSEKFKRKASKVLHNIDDIIPHLMELEFLREDSDKIEKERAKSGVLNIDKTIAHFLNPKRHYKKTFNSKKYRKMFKQEAKAEKREYKEMVKLGYIKSNSPDDELRKMGKLKKVNEQMKNILSDGYSQKHPL